MDSGRPDADRVSAAIYDISSNDPAARLIDRSSMSPEDLAQLNDLMNELGRMRIAERRLMEASVRYMKLNETDMRALHFLIACANQGVIATPGAIAGHLRISTASTTKLLDRLEAAGHVTRTAHPTDRRALAISVAKATHEAARHSVGRRHTRRFMAAAAFSPAERDVVIRFLRAMTESLGLEDADWLEEDDAPEGRAAGRGARGR